MTSGPGGPRAVRSWSPCHLVTLSPCHLVTLSPCHLVTLSPLLRRSEQFRIHLLQDGELGDLHFHELLAVAAAHDLCGLLDPPQLLVIAAPRFLHELAA